MRIIPTICPRCSVECSSGCAEFSSGQDSAPFRQEAAPSIRLLNQPRANLPASDDNRPKVLANSAAVHPGTAPVACPVEEPKVPSLASCASSRATLSRHREYDGASQECHCARCPDRARPPRRSVRSRRGASTDSPTLSTAHRKRAAVSQSREKYLWTLAVTLGKWQRVKAANAFQECLFPWSTPWWNRVLCALCGKRLLSPCPPKRISTKPAATSRPSKTAMPTTL